MSEQKSASIIWHWLLWTLTVEKSKRQYRHSSSVPSIKSDWGLGYTSVSVDKSEPLPTEVLTRYETGNKEMEI